MGQTQKSDGLIDARCSALMVATGHFYYILRNTQTNFTFSYFLRLLDQPIDGCYAFFIRFT